jgi:sortase B
LEENRNIEQPENTEPKDKKKLLWLILVILCAVVFLSSLTALIIHIFPKKDDFSEFYNDSTPSDTVSDEKEDVVLPDNPIDFAALEAQNADVCGWIRIPDTKVDYPILQSGEDKAESFYLNHDINGKYKFAGCIYIQKLNDRAFTDPNTVIYGHNMKNGTMFSDIRKYRRRAFMDEHPNIYVYTPGHILTYEVFSAFVYDDRHILYSFDFGNEEEYGSFLSTCLAPKSHTKMVNADTSVTTKDKIITLSTCTGVDTERYIVIGVLRDDTPTKMPNE